MFSTIAVFDSHVPDLQSHLTAKLNTLAHLIFNFIISRQKL